MKYRITYFLPIAILLCMPGFLMAQIYGGGNGNGFSSTLALVNLSVTDSLYNGGDDDGISQNSLLSADLSIADSLYNSSNGNGFSQVTSFNTILFIWDSLYNGGSGRGESFIAILAKLNICGTVFTWTGNNNTSWDNPLNWDCGTVPGINNIVIIPAGLSRYPTVSSSTEIKSMVLQSGSSINVKPGVVLTLNGF